MCHNKMVLGIMLLASVVLPPLLQPPAAVVNEVRHAPRSLCAPVLVLLLEVPLGVQSLRRFQEFEVEVYPMADGLDYHSSNLYRNSTPLMNLLYRWRDGGLGTVLPRCWLSWKMQVAVGHRWI